MLKNASLLLVSLLPVFLGCVRSQSRQTVLPSSIAYVDMAVLYSYVLTHDPEFREYKSDPNFLSYRNRSDIQSVKEIKRSLLVKIEGAVRYVAKENGFAAIFSKSDSLVYAESSLDITQTVIHELQLRNRRRSIRGP